MNKIIITMICLIVLSSNAFALDETLKDIAFQRTTKITADFSGNSMIGTATYLGNMNNSGYWLSAGHVVYEYTGDIFINSHLATIVDAGYMHYPLETVASRTTCTENGCTVIPQHERISSDSDWVVLKTPEYFPNILPTMMATSASLDENFFYVNVMKYETINKIKYKNTTNNTMTFTMVPEYGNSGAGVFNHKGQLIGIVVERQCNPRRTIVTKITEEVLNSFLNGF